jgi:ribulose-5-phosphate 4-epimerase/fuculose-1-phosphate aldolase
MNQLLNHQALATLLFQKSLMNGTLQSSPFDDSGFLIHSSVYAARPDVNAICHAHTVHGKAWSVFARPLDMLTQDVCDIFDAHGVYAEYGGVVSTAEEGRKIAAALGQGKGCFLMNHGLMTVGATVDEAGYLLGMMERSCQVQLLVESAGLPKKIIPDGQAARNFKLQSTPVSRKASSCSYQILYGVALC